MEEIEYLCDYIVIMDKGEIIANGTYDELINKIDLVEFIEIEYNNEFNDDVVNEIKTKEVVEVNKNNPYYNWSLLFIKLIIICSSTY